MKIADCLPAKLLVLCCYLDKLDQIRIVANKPVRVSLEGATYYVGKNGLQNGPCDAICVGDEEVGDLVKTACQNSIYAFERQLGNGYLTLDDGSRIGVSGKGFVDKNGQVFFSDYKGVCIRLNRHVVGCSGVVGSNKLSSSVLVVGLPGFGKTTFLREMACRASKILDVVVLDERGELSLVDGFERNYLGDVLLYLEREKAAVVALRSLSPNVLVCDEIFDDDLPWLRRALSSGIKVYASMHASSFDAAKECCVKNGLDFDFYVVLQQFGGKMAKLYDKTANYIIL